MSSTRPMAPVNVRRSRRQRWSGWALSEMVLALLLVVLAGGLVVRAVGLYQHRRYCERFAAELREFAEIFAAYAPRSGAPMTTGDEATLPADLQRRLQTTNWFKGSPFGGTYGWRRRSTGAGRDSSRAALTLTAFAPNFPLTIRRADLERIDRAIDDDNLATGRFRTGFNGWPVYLLDDGP